MESGVDVEVGVEEKKVRLLLDELEFCGKGSLDCDALKWIEIKDVVRDYGDAELISA